MLPTFKAKISLLLQTLAVLKLFMMLWLRDLVIGGDLALDFRRFPLDGPWKPLEVWRLGRWLLRDHLLSERLYTFWKVGLVSLLFVRC